MRQIKVEKRRRVRIPHGHTEPAKTRTPRCDQHPDVHMVLAGTHIEHNAVRYMCPLCHAMGRPPIEVAVGTIRTYLPERGYGFIDNGGPRIFFHISDWKGEKPPEVNMSVTCHLSQNEHGLIARQVHPQ